MNDLLIEELKNKIIRWHNMALFFSRDAPAIASTLNLCAVELESSIRILGGIDTGLASGVVKSDYIPYDSA